MGPTWARVPNEVTSPLAQYKWRSALFLQLSSTEMAFWNKVVSVGKTTPWAFHQVLVDPKRSSYAYLAAIWIQHSRRWPNWILEFGWLDLEVFFLIHDVSNGCIHGSHSHIIYSWFLVFCAKITKQFLIYIFLTNELEVKKKKNETSVFISTYCETNDAHTLIWKYM